MASGPVPSGSGGPASRRSSISSETSRADGDGSKKRKVCASEADEDELLVRMKQVGKRLMNYVLGEQSKITKSAATFIYDCVADMEDCLTVAMLMNERLQGQLDVYKSASVERRSYAGVTASAAKTTSKMTSVSSVSAVVPEKKTERFAIVVRPSEGNMESEAVKQKVLKEIGPAMKQVRVKAVRKIRSGGIAIETVTARELESLRKCKNLMNVV